MGNPVTTDENRLHLGDIVFDGTEKVYGDGVGKFASRIESLGVAGFNTSFPVT